MRYEIYIFITFLREKHQLFIYFRTFFLLKFGILLRNWVVYEVKLENRDRISDGSVNKKVKIYSPVVV